MEDWEELFNQRRTRAKSYNEASTSNLMMMMATRRFPERKDKNWIELLKEQHSCCICLDEFNELEDEANKKDDITRSKRKLKKKLRMIHGCSHIFHEECIIGWLTS